jgi:hypothetical protein
MEKKIEKYNDVQELVNDKVDVFTDTMIEDIQDIVKSEFPEVEGFTWGILPPEYEEVKSKLKDIISNYIHENIVYQTDERLKEEEFLVF